MFAIGNNELDTLPDLVTNNGWVGCHVCGAKHRVIYGTVTDRIKNVTKPYKGLTAIKCGDKTFLIAVNGKDIRRQK